MEPTERCGYIVTRGTDFADSRIKITAGVGSLYLDAAVYDRINDEAFERFMNAWLAGDYAETCVALGEPDPRDGLKHLAEANERERARQALMTPEEIRQMHEAQNAAADVALEA